MLFSILMGLSAATALQAEGGATARADLPPLMEFADGRPVRTAEEWKERRAEIRRLMGETFMGTFPKAPKLLGAETLREERRDDGALERRVQLTFDTPSRIAFEICLWIPEGDGPFPVLMTVPVEWQVDLKCFWPQAAVKRGYMACLYPGVSFTCKPAKGYETYKNALGAFRKDYPEATMADLPGSAWIAGRAIDYLVDPQYGCPAKPGQIGIIGHSRYGKQSLIAAALDERIDAVVARSPGSPGSCPYRFTSRNTFAETSVDFPGDWFLSSLQAYYGREDRLPIDAHGWLALIAPRPCLIHTAYNDGCEPTFAVERAYLQGREVYRFLGKPVNLHVEYRPGGHDPTTEEHRDLNFAWFDLAFGRGTAKQSDFPERLLHAFDFEVWSAQQTEADLTPPAGEAKEKEDAAALALERIRWALGREPEKIDWDGQLTFLSDEESELMTHDRWRSDDVERVPVSFGANVRGNVYYSKKVTGPAPALIWLHPYSYQSGYNEGYGVQDTAAYCRMAEDGFVVLAFDQCGFGLRLLEGTHFYEKYPNWSRLGRMVADARAAVDFLSEGKGSAKSELPQIDAKRIVALGYSVGGAVGLYAAALDERISAVACFSGFTPMRSDADSKATGGLRRLWLWHALQPKLGLYRDRYEDLPYDYDDVIERIAPRPCLIVSPTRDRDADLADTIECVSRARVAWKKAGAEDALEHSTPTGYNQFQAEQHHAFIRWARKIGLIEAPSDKN